MSIVSLVRSGNEYASGRVSYEQASTYFHRHTYYATVLVFMCMYVRMTLAVSSFSYTHEIMELSMVNLSI